jgi:hypothetical protein
MRRTIAACVVLGLAAAGCGGRQQLLQPDDSGAGATGTATIGPVDLTQAPPTLPMTCDSGVGMLAFDNPCLVGMNVAGDPSKPGFHEVECRLTAAGHPIAWAFLLPLAQLAATPDEPLVLPTDAPMTPSSGQLVDVAGLLKARVLGVAGTVTFSRIDPEGRAFSARLQGTITWVMLGGSMFTCAVDAPFWGAPGSFL